MLFCTRWFGVSTYGMGRKVLSDMHGVSPVLFETGFWEFFIYIWAIWAVFSILAISMARSKTSGRKKGPAPLWSGP